MSSRTYSIHETYKGFVVTYSHGAIISENRTWTEPTIEDAARSILDDYAAQKAA